MYWRSPHHRLVDNDLYFMASHKSTASLNTEQIALWHALEKCHTNIALTEMLGSYADSDLKHFLVKRYCYETQDSWPNNRKRVLVFEPHCDDAALSIGATMLQSCDECEFIIVTLGALSNFTSYFYSNKEYFDREKVSDLRHREGALFTAMIGGEYRALEYGEATLRYCDADWDINWFRAHKYCITACTNHRASPEVLNTWRSAVAKQITGVDPDEIWFPLGLGFHSDHELTRNAVLDYLIHAPTEKSRFSLFAYTDVPYDVHFPVHRTQIVNELVRSGAVVEQIDNRVSTTFDRKLELLSVFASQFKVSSISGNIERSALPTGNQDPTPIETYFQITRLPRTLNFSRLHPNQSLFEKNSRVIRRIIDNKDKITEVRIFLTTPSGRLRDDIIFFQNLLQTASFIIYSTDSSYAEASLVKSERVSVVNNGSGLYAWLKLVSSSLFRGSNLSIYTPGRRFLFTRIVSRICNFSLALVMPTLDDVTRAFLAQMPRSEEY